MVRAAHSAFAVADVRNRGGEAVGVKLGCPDELGGGAVATLPLSTRSVMTIERDWAQRPAMGVHHFCCRLLHAEPQLSVRDGDD